MIIESFPNSQYRFEFYINYDKLTYQQIKAQKKCKGIINLGFYDMAAYSAAKTKQAVLNSTACDFILDGKPIKPLKYAEFGLCINDNGDLFLGVPQGKKNYCIGLPPQYISGEKYIVNKPEAKNGCTHIGFKADGTPVWLLAEKVVDSAGRTIGGMTNDEANQAMRAYGCFHILRYDGSWSSQGDFGNGKTCTPKQTRIVQSYLLAYERNEAKPDDTKGTEKVKLIAIDAGHGMNTAGKRCMKSIDPNETREWFLNNRIACYVEAMLAEYDCETMRLDDVTGKTDVALNTRVTRANNAKADVLASIHANAAINGGPGGGICVFAAVNGSQTSDKLQKAVYKHTVEKTKLKGNRWDGVPDANFYVIYKSSMPAFLGEFGFMDSTTDVPIILTDDFARKCAEGIVLGIVEVMEIPKKSTPAAPTNPVGNIIYRVQVGAFANAQNAENLKRELEAKGYKPFITKEETA